tara:strand:- start:168 stop:329 length:162 start_codon:yes stop_codon:yes gene_type:complete
MTAFKSRAGGLDGLLWRWLVKVGRFARSMQPVRGGNGSGGSCGGKVKAFLRAD